MGSSLFVFWREPHTGVMLRGAHTFGQCIVGVEEDRFTFLRMKAEIKRLLLPNVAHQQSSDLSQDILQELQEEPLLLLNIQRIRMEQKESILNRFLRHIGSLQELHVCLFVRHCSYTSSTFLLIASINAEACAYVCVTIITLD